MDFPELLAMVLLGVCFAIPEADAQNSTGFGIGDEHHLVDEAALFFQGWELPSHRWSLQGFSIFLICL
jgi:hypothetical protein